jgi:prepilin-type N-terminal cleavage/methylation domain-containing protein
MQQIGRASFTLLELLIVVVIASILMFYATAIFPTDKNRSIKLQDLKLHLLEKNDKNGIMCLDKKEDGLECFFCQKSKKNNTENLKLIISRDIEVYRFNNDFLDLQQIYYEPNECYDNEKKYGFDDYDIKFYYKLDMGEFIIEMGEKAYMFSNSSKTIKVYDSIDDIQNSYQTAVDEARDAI